MFLINWFKQVLRPKTKVPKYLTDWSVVNNDQLVDLVLSSLLNSQMHFKAGQFDQAQACYNMALLRPINNSPTVIGCLPEAELYTLTTNQALAKHYLTTPELWPNIPAHLFIELVVNEA